MKKLIKPSQVKGIIHAPASKSVAQRAIAIASLAKGRSEIIYTGHSEDVLAAIRVCRTMGAEISEQADALVIEGGLKIPPVPLNCGESGLGIRMFSAIAASLGHPVTLSGEGTLLKRPMDIIEHSLGAMGVDCSSHSGYLPLTVKGPFPGGEFWIDGSFSSQALTGILIASPLAAADTIIHVRNLQSKPYIDLTIQVMGHFGVQVQNEEHKVFRVKKSQQYIPGRFDVEGDWSGASFMLVAGAIAGKVGVRNLQLASPQADKSILDALRKAGAGILIGKEIIEVSNRELRAFQFDATDCPDLFPPLVALALYCHGESRIMGVHRLKGKESDRAETLMKEFSKLGAQIRLKEDEMCIVGTGIDGGRANSHNDHRIAMACTVAALGARGEVDIHGAEAVAKSYPQFFEDLDRIRE
jgi:3-phosphoshikimate 1-carboxyvinyltransferase